MKSWLTQFKISCALDDADGVCRRAARSAGCEEVRQFQRSIQALDQRLKAVPPERSVPVGLHASVMRAVRDASKLQERTSTPWMLRLLPAPALVLMVVAGVWWALSRPVRDSRPLVTTGAVLEQSHQLTQRAPAVMLAPLSKEMNNLNRDFRNAVEILLASMP